MRKRKRIVDVTAGTTGRPTGALLVAAVAT
jgi:hypothetical protein